jgi:speckle-type POZ protein
MARSAPGWSWTEDVELWVKRVVEFSSEYNNHSWAACCVIGEPRVYPRYGDIQGAWAQGNVSDSEYIIVEFAEKLFIESVEAYETLNAGAIVRISAWNADGGEWITRWEADNLMPQVIQTSRCFMPTLQKADFATDRLKLELNCTLAQSWCEIDAVKIKGKRMLCPQPPQLTELSSNLRQLVNNDLFADVTFEVEDQQVHAHRAILSVRSEYFRAMFRGGLKESNSRQTITVNDVSYLGFVAMMQFIYTNSFDNSVLPLHMVELIRIGDRFSLEGMKTLSYCRLCTEITTVNVIDIYRDAVDNLPRLEDVEHLCLNFIANHLDLVAKVPAFCQLPQPVMLSIIQDATARLSLHK